MAVDIGSYNTAEEVYDRIIERLTNSTFMGAGNQWTKVFEYNDNGTTETYGEGKSVGMQVPGVTGTGDYLINLCFYSLYSSAAESSTIRAYAGKNAPSGGFINGGNYNFVGQFASGVSYNVGDCVLFSSDDLYVCIVAHTGSNSYDPADYAGQAYWRNVSTGFSSSKGFYEELSGTKTLYSPLFKMATVDAVNGIDYWLVADKKRAIIVIRSGTRWSTMYAGGYSCFFSMSYNDFPVLLSGQNYDYTGSFEALDISNWPNSHYISGSSSGTATFLSPSGNYRNEQSSSGVSFPLLRPFDRLISGEYILTPIYVIMYGDLSDHAEDGLYGVVEDVFTVDSDGLTSGDIIVMDGDNYLAVEDVYRGNIGNFAAIKIS